MSDMGYKCNNCRGDGYIFENECPTCDGTGFLSQSQIKTIAKRELARIKYENVIMKSKLDKIQKALEDK